MKSKQYMQPSQSRTIKNPLSVSIYKKQVKRSIEQEEFRRLY